MQKLKSYSAVALALIILMPNVLAAQNPQLVADAKLYQARCSQCHSIDIANNPASGLLPSQIMELVVRMKNMPDSQIQQHEVQSLYRYVLFNVYAHKRDQLKAQLDALSKEEKAREVNALKQAINAYK